MELSTNTAPQAPLSQQFNKGQHPVGQLINYSDNQSWRATDEEQREKERLLQYNYDDMRKAAECHRQVRRWAQSALKPGIELHNFTEQLENYTRFLLQSDGLQGGVGFPTGVSIDNVAAHYTPNPGEKKYLNSSNVCSVDIGIHVNGMIVDSAFTIAFDSKFENLLNAPKEATEAGLNAVGIDARLGEIGAVIQETMESFEIDLDGQTRRIKVVKDLCGHSIEPYLIHGEKSVPCIAVEDNTKMEEGEVFAIETFGTTGKGKVRERGETSHFMIEKNMFGKSNLFKSRKTRSLLAHIKQQYATLPWSRRQLKHDGFSKHIRSLNRLIRSGIVEPYPPLVDIRGSYVAQFEHTVILRPTCKEIISRGDDY